MSVASTVLYPAQFVVRPNRSLSWSGNKLFIATLAVVSFGIAGAFASVGMWMILPFAGLEMAALTLGLYLCSVKTRGCEVISIDGDHVQVEVGRNKPQQSVRFQRAWTSVVLIPSAHKSHPSRLVVRSMGKSVEIGACLTESERKELARSLVQAIASANR